MDGTATLYVALLIVTIVISGFFSASEAAFLSCRPSRVRHMVDSKVAGARRMSALVEHPERFLPTLLIGNNLINTAAATLGTLIALRLFQDQGIAAVVATIVVAVLLIIFGESIPKTVGARLAERLALVVATPVVWIERLVFPLAAPVQALNRFVSRSLGRTASRDLATQEELKVLISLGRETGVLQETGADMLLRLIRATTRPVSDVMTPHTEIVYISKGTTIAQFLEFNARQHFSRFPVMDEHGNNVVGIVNARDVLQAIGRGALKDTDSVVNLVRTPFFVPETKPVTETIAEMRQRGENLALVVDEFGGIAGLVTYKQLVGHIMGEVKEEGVRDKFRKIDNHTFEVEGSMRVYEANERLGLGLPEGDYDTIAGFMMSALGHIPVKGERLHYGNLDLVAAEVRGTKVEKVVVKVTPTQEIEE